MTKLFLKFELGKIIKYFRDKTLAKLITGFLFMMVFLFIGIGIYHFFVSGFRYINVEAMEDIRLALTLFLYELFLLVLAGIIIFSSMVSGIFNLFRGGNNNWILSSPGYTIFPKLVLVRSLVSSALPLLVMFLPAILALHKVYSLSILSLFFITVSVILFLILLNALTLLAIVAVGFSYYQLSQKIGRILFTFKGLIALLLLLSTVTISIVWKAVINIDLVNLFKSEAVTTEVSIPSISNHFNFLPTHPFAMEIINWQTGQSGAALFDFSILLLLAILSVYMWWRLSFLFYPLWQKFQEGDVQTEAKISSSSRNRMLYHFNGSTTMVLFKKEVLISSRNFKGVLWFLFLLFIWLMQIGANVILNHNIQRYQPDISQKMVTLQVLQYIIAIYFICSFTLRFVFPSFSTEKKTAWILGSAPLSFTRIFFSKYLFYTSFFVAVGVLMNSINNSILNIPFTHAFYSMILFVSVIIFIVTLGLALGALFPSTKTDDPEVISTSMPGLFFTALALIYGAVSDWILYITLTQRNIVWLSLFVLVTFVLVGILLLKIPRLVKNRAFE